jgi:hypothetical protein
MPRRPFALSLLLPILGFTSIRAADPVPAVDLSGKWCGSWKSCKDGHTGPLNATFCKIDESCYQVRFSGRFFAVIPFRYTVNLNVTGQSEGQVLLSGSSNLPLVGTYRYTAVATDKEFRAEYSSRNDYGQFNLCR